MTEVKRRGRPPGAKNRPKLVPPEPDLDLIDVVSEAAPKHIDRTNGAASIESYTLGPRGITVVVNFRMAMSTEPVTESVDWPPGWPIPQLNDVIRTKGGAGRVQWVEYDQAVGVIRITTN